MEIKFGKQKFCEQGFIYKHLVLNCIRIKNESGLTIKILQQVFVENAYL